MDLDFDDLIGRGTDALAALTDDPDVIAAKVALAEEAAEYARSIAPENTGAYRDSIVVEQSGSNVYVAFNDPAAHLVEYGSEHNQEYAVRARTEEHFNNQ